MRTKTLRKLVGNPYRKLEDIHTARKELRRRRKRERKARR